MRTRPVTILGLAAVVPVVLLTLSCSDEPATGPEPPDPDPENVAPTLSPIPAQTVLRNTISPRSVEVALQIDDPDDDSYTVMVASDDEGVVSGSTFGCGAGPCVVTLTPSPEATASVTLDVTVEDGRGGQAVTSFEVNVVPHLVTGTGDDGPGTLRTAVESAEPGDVIGFDTDGAFAGSQTIGLLGQIVLDEDLTIEGPGADRLTVSGNGSVRVLRVTGGAEVIVRDLTLADGRAEIEEIALAALDTAVFRAWGGAVFMDTESKLTLRGCVVAESVAEAGEGPGGGAIFNLEGTLVVEGCDIHDNSSASGGGIFNVGPLGSPVTAVTSLSNSTISNNTATTAGASGGGIFNGGALIVDGSRIVGNAAAGRGGGVNNGFGGSTVIRNGSEISENSADRGGGIFNEGSLTITGSTVESNSSATDGGGIENGIALSGIDAIVTLEAGSTVLGNVAAELGGGIHNAGDDAIVVLEAGASVTGNTAGAPVPGGGGIFNEGTLENDGDVSGNTPDDVAP